MAAGKELTPPAMRKAMPAPGAIPWSISPEISGSAYTITLDPEAWAAAVALFRAGSSVEIIDAANGILRARSEAHFQAFIADLDREAERRWPR